jgi:hypothetical protein
MHVRMSWGVSKGEDDLVLGAQHTHLRTFRPRASMVCVRGDAASSSFFAETTPPAPICDDCGYRVDTAEHGAFCEDAAHDIDRVPT